MNREYVICPKGLNLYPWQKETIANILPDGDWHHWKRNMSLYVHRRGGKTILLLEAFLRAALMRVGAYGWFFPFTIQARDVVWDAVLNDGRRFHDLIPKCLLKKIDNREMKWILVNGSSISLGGTAILDIGRGSNFAGIGFDEAADHRPDAIDIYRPIFMHRDNKGFMWQIGTPKGKENHFHKHWLAGQEDPNCYTNLLTIENTCIREGVPIISEESLERERESGIPEEFIQQEYYCNVNAPCSHAIYSDQLMESYSSGRVKELSIIKGVPTVATFDIGWRDKTCVIVAQILDNRVNFVYNISVSKTTMGDVCRMLREFEHQYDCKINMVYLPHDGKNKQVTSGKSAEDIVREEGFEVICLPRSKNSEEISVRIYKVRKKFSQFYFDPFRVNILLECLSKYRRSWQADKVSFSLKPVHDEYMDMGILLEYFILGIEIYNPGESSISGISSPYGRSYICNV